MGVSISSKNKSLDLTYSGFFRLRSEIANAVDKDLGKLYSTITQGYNLSLEERDEFFSKFDQDLNDIEQRKGIDSDIIDFLMMSDTSGEIAASVVEKILYLLSLITEERNYGYGIRPVTNKDILSLFKDASENKTAIEWY